MQSSSAAMTAMTSSEAAALDAFDYEQFEAAALVTSRLGGVSPAVLETAEAGRERERAAAHRAALAAGRAAGMAAAQAEIASAIAALKAALDGVEALRDEVAARFESDAVELALSLAQRIVAGSLEVAPERVLDVVRGALRRVTDRHRITIVVHPDDVALVSEQLDALNAELGGIDEGTVQGDRRVGRGGAIVQTSEGAIDAEIESQLDRARAVVAEDLARG
jgi:flagellar assembly protein FliH